MSQIERELFIQQIHKSYPGLKSTDFQSLIADHLIAPLSVPLPQKAFDQAARFAQIFHKVRTSKNYLARFESQLSNLKIHNPGNFGICMSFDFHWDPESQLLKLIEVNTNAAFLALGDLLYRMRNLPSPYPNFQLVDLKSCIEREIELHTGVRPKSQLKVAIVDDEPEKQRLYSEFLIFRQLFQSWGWEAEIFDCRNLVGDFDFIYNRSTDFYFQEPQSQNLKSYYGGPTTVSPNPYEYLVSAEKGNLAWLSDSESALALQKLLGENDYNVFQSHLLKTRTFNSDTKELAWAEKKKSFFKPKNAYGSKQSYKGASVSRKAFDELAQNEFLVQEYCPAPGISYSPGGQPSVELKYDLRFFAYQDQIQMAVARLYEGQVTNLKSMWGGFAPLTILS